MKVVLFTDDLRDASTDIVAIGVFSDEEDRGIGFSQLNQLLNGALESACRDEDFKGEPGQTVVFNVADGVPARRVLVYGYGDRKAYGPESARRFAGTVARTAEKVGAKSCSIQLAVPEVPAPAQWILGLVQALAEGAVLGHYTFVEFLTKERRPPSLKELRIAFDTEDVQGVRGASLRAAVARGLSVAAGVCAARNLVNEPPNVLSPAALAERAKRMCKAEGIACKVLGPRDLERQRMALHVAVGRGSSNEPQLVHMTYQPESKKKDLRVIALVGKGLTFDAGGLSLKTSEGMSDMKVDMGGAAAVMGTLKAIARIKPECIVHGIVGAAENMPDGNAIRPGDVFTSKKGITVEVLNTDAEGRLVLADALAYAQTLQVTEIVDVATLTGACMVALGRLTAGAFINDEAMALALREAWDRSGESFWRMPLASELRETLDSEVADIKNVGERWGGAITAALFLREFIDAGTKWAHLDIAGPVVAQKEGGYTAKGGTGFGVRTLVEYVAGPGSPVV